MPLESLIRLHSLSVTLGKGFNSLESLDFLIFVKMREIALGQRIVVD